MVTQSQAIYGLCQAIGLERVLGSECLCRLILNWRDSRLLKDNEGHGRILV
jgi:hypothetical protein